METYCTRPSCPRPQNYFGDLDDNATMKTVQQKYCTTCGMPLILIGRYLPLKLLGRGGFGAAFLSLDRYTPRMQRCVVKQFKPSGDLNAAQLELAQKLFEREAEVLEDIGRQHSQIPDLFAFFELTVPGLQPGRQEQLFYLVQEFIDGQNLEEELQEKGKFSEAEALHVLQETLKLLRFVHGNGVIHRDVKPSNIMRHRNGKLYLLDFGAVKQVTKAVSESGGSSTGIYSMGFAPPEQMAGGQVYPSTDLYALAVTILMLLTGKQATDLYDAFSNKWNWRSQVTVSDQLADVLDRMLLSAPSQRFQSAEEVLEALSPRPIWSPTAPTQVSPQPPTLPPSIPPTPIPSRTPPPVVQSARPAFSTLELLAGAGFSGFEGGLIAIALYGFLRAASISLRYSFAISLGLAAVILLLLIFAQTRRWIERKDLLIIPVLTLVIVFFVPVLRAGLPLSTAIFLAAVGGLIAIALTAVFRLIYKLLSLLF